MVVQLGPYPPELNGSRNFFNKFKKSSLFLNGKRFTPPPLLKALPFRIATPQSYNYQEKKNTNRYMSLEKFNIELNRTRQIYKKQCIFFTFYGIIVIH